MKKVILIATLILAIAAFAYADSISDLTKRAESGDVEAQYELGVKYMHEEYDAEAAIPWLEKAAYAGHSEAQYELGLAIFDGEGVEADIIKGCSWLYTTKVDAAAYGCTQLNPEDRTKALEEAKRLQERLKK